MPTNYKPFPIIEVKFKGSRKEFFVNTDNIYLEAGELVVVEAATGGYDVGHVSVTGELVRMQMTKRRVKQEDVSKKIYRKATVADVEKWKAAKDLEWETMHRSRKLALELNLSMKLSDVDYQGDKTKATFYYTAEGRVDFRELIKKMAEAFRIRIEMRQIGMRQEASRLGGIGSCGRELCCSTWLTDFKTVSTSAARYQNLSLNTLKLAGQCGKLKCCLNYELDTYMDALKYIPDNVNVLKTKKGDARLQKTDIFKRVMWFSFPMEESWIPLTIVRVKEIQQQNKEGIFPEDLGVVIEEETQPVKALDYENVVGQDSLTRLDERSQNRNRNKKKSRNKNSGGAQNAQGSNPQQQNRPQNNQQQQKPQQSQQQQNRPQQHNRPRPEQKPANAASPEQQLNKAQQQNVDGNKPANSGGGNRRHKHRRHGNKPNTQGGGGGNQQPNNQ